jgi:glycosyltransferase involved in cell wall biosynthesis
MLLTRSPQDHNPYINLLLVVRHPVGGIRTFLRYVYNQFDPLMYNVTIIAPVCNEMTVLVNDLKKHKIAFIPLGKDPSSGEVFKTIFKTIRNNKFDLTHSQGLTAGLLSAFPAKIYRIPHMMTAHDVFLKNQFKGSAGGLKKIILMTVLSLIDKIHCVSRDVMDNYMEFIPGMSFLKHKFCVIPNGIEIDRFLNAKPVDLRKQLGLAEDTFLIGFLGRFMSQKGFKYLVESLEIMIGRHNLPKKPLILAFGEGGFIREEKQIINDKGLKDYIIFMPFEPNIAPVLKGLDVVAMPSLWEACPLQPMEAMISGVPVIGTDCIGLREVLKDTPSVITPIKDSSALAEALLNEMNNSSLSMVKAFVEEAVDRFDVFNSAELIKDLIQGLCVNKK